MVKNNSLKTNLKVSEDVIITAARLAALDIDGVAGLKKSGILKRNAPIVVTRISDVIAVRVSIIVKNGVKAAAVALKVQNAVKENIQNMAGITVARVDVTVAGISADS